MCLLSLGILIIVLCSVGTYILYSIIGLKASKAMFASERKKTTKPLSEKTFDDHTQDILNTPANKTSVFGDSFDLGVSEMSYFPREENNPDMSFDKIIVKQTSLPYGSFMVQLKGNYLFHPTSF